MTKLIRRTNRKHFYCTIKGCKKPHYYNGMCGMHAQRVLRYGDPHYVTSHKQFKINCREAQLKRFEEPGSVKPTTYRKRYNRHEHRVVAEEMLGRKLRKGEIVHHKDDNKHNNHPSNLQVMTQADHIRLHHKQMMEARAAKTGSATASKRRKTPAKKP